MIKMNIHIQIINSLKKYQKKGSFKILTIKT